MRARCQHSEREMVTAANWIARHVLADALIASHDIGVLGHYARRQLVDIAGLLSPDLLPFIHDADALWQYLDSRDVAILMAFPNQIPGFHDRDRRLCHFFLPMDRA